MLVSFATRIVADQALPAIKLKAEFTQTPQREAWNLRNHHLCRPLVRHPGRQLRQCPVRLADDQGNFIAMTNASRRNDRLATARVKPVPDRDLTRLVVSITSLLRRHLVSS